jgi:hypothetical protein
LRAFAARLNKGDGTPKQRRQHELERETVQLSMHSIYSFETEIRAQSVEREPLFQGFGLEEGRKRSYPNFDAKKRTKSQVPIDEISREGCLRRR